MKHKHRGFTFEVSVRLVARTEEVLGCAWLASLALAASVLDCLESLERVLRELMLLASALLEAVRKVIQSRIQSSMMPYCSAIHHPVIDDLRWNIGADGFHILEKGY